MPIVKLLVQAKNFDPDVKDGLGWTPLMMACSRKDSEAMVELLLLKDAIVNETSSFKAQGFGILILLINKRQRFTDGAAFCFFKGQS
jgi:ankyrin repeat protein